MEKESICHWLCEKNLAPIRVNLRVGWLRLFCFELRGENAISRDIRSQGWTAPFTASVLSANITGLGITAEIWDWSPPPDKSFKKKRVSFMPLSFLLSFRYAVEVNKPDLQWLLLTHFQVYLLRWELVWALDTVKCLNAVNVEYRWKKQGRRKAKKKPRKMKHYWVKKAITRPHGVMDLKLTGKLFQSRGASNLKAFSNQHLTHSAPISAQLLLHITSVTIALW